MSGLIPAGGVQFHLFT